MRVSVSDIFGNAWGGIKHTGFAVCELRVVAPLLGVPAACHVRNKQSIQPRIECLASPVISAAVLEERLERVKGGSTPLTSTNKLLNPAISRA